MCSLSKGVDDPNLPLLTLLFRLISVMKKAEETYKENKKKPRVNLQELRERRCSLGCLNASFRRSELHVFGRPVRRAGILPVSDGRNLQRALRSFRPAERRSLRWGVGGGRSRRPKRSFNSLRDGLFAGVFFVRNAASKERKVAEGF